MFRPHTIPQLSCMSFSAPCFVLEINTRKETDSKIFFLFIHPTRFISKALFLFWAFVVLSPSPDFPSQEMTNSTHDLHSLSLLLFEPFECGKTWCVISRRKKVTTKRCKFGVTPINCWLTWRRTECVNRAGCYSAYACTTQGFLLSLFCVVPRELSRFCTLDSCLCSFAMFTANLQRPCRVESKNKLRKVWIVFYRIRRILFPHNCSQHFQQFSLGHSRHFSSMRKSAPACCACAFVCLCRKRKHFLVCFFCAV